MENSDLLSAFQEFVRSNGQISKLLEVLPECEIQFQIKRNLGLEGPEISNFNISSNNKRKRDEEKKDEENKKQKLISQVPSFLPNPSIFYRTINLQNTNFPTSCPPKITIVLTNSIDKRPIDLSKPILPNTKIDVLCNLIENVKIVYYFNYGHGSTKIETKNIDGRTFSHYFTPLHIFHLNNYNSLKISMLVTPLPSNKIGPIYGIEEFDLLAK
jgi:hypothetical protein